MTEDVTMGWDTDTINGQLKEDVIAPGTLGHPYRKVQNDPLLKQNVELSRSERLV